MERNDLDPELGGRVDRDFGAQLTGDGEGIGPETIRLPVDLQVRESSGPAPA